MLFHTKSTGVRRLSIILGLIAGGCLVVTVHTPIYYGENKVYWNLLNIALLFATGFAAAWLTVRVVAWIVAGFINGRNNGL